jgi:hypothetical protein
MLMQAAVDLVRRIIEALNRADVDGRPASCQVTARMRKACTGAGRTGDALSGRGPWACRA